MRYFVWQATIVDEAGNVQPLATVTVRDADTNNLVQLYDDVDGVYPAGNPLLTDSAGYVVFYAVAGRYTITAALGGFSRTWENVRLGTLGSELHIERTGAELAALVTPENFQYWPGPIIDVRRFGPIAGGVSTAALQNAINSCPAGFALWIGEDYETDELVATDWSSRAIIGPGSLTLTDDAASNAVILRLAGTCNKVRVSGPSFVGRNDGSTDQVGITGGPSATLSDILIEGASFYDLNAGVYVAGSAGAGRYGGWRIIANHFDNIVGTASGRGLGVVMESRAASVEPQLVIIAQNHFRRTQRHAVYMGAGDHLVCNIVNNQFDLHRDGVATVTQRPAVTVGRCKHGLISGNTFYRCADGSVDVFFDTALSKTGEGVLINGNKFINRANAWPDVTIGQTAVPTDYDVLDVKISGNQFAADQDDAGAQPFVDILNGRRVAVTDNDFEVSNADDAQYIVRLGSDAAISANEDCDETAIENNRAWVQGAAASSCRFLAVAADICTNSSKHSIQRNTLYGPQYIDFATSPPTNANLKTDAAGSYTGALTGCATAPTGTIEWSVNGREVTLEIPAIAATSNSTALKTVTGMPVAIRPAAEQVVLALITDNGVTSWGRVSIGTGGVITLQFNNLGVFTNPGTAGIQACTIHYKLD